MEQRVTDARGNEGELEHTHLGWHRLLALFTVVYRGVDHPDLDLIAHDGSLFDPDAYAWLEGRESGDASPAVPLAVVDRTVLHMLRAVQTVTIGGGLLTVSFPPPAPADFRSVVEGPLSFSCLPAPAPALTTRPSCSPRKSPRARWNRSSTSPGRCRPPTGPAGSSAPQTRSWTSKSPTSRWARAHSSWPPAGTWSASSSNPGRQ